MNQLSLYLALERVAGKLADLGEEALCEAVRSRMDEVWRKLTTEEIASLDARGKEALTHA